MNPHTPSQGRALVTERQRRELDERYDFRYSVLVFVFAGLLRRGLIDEAELAALGEGKAHLIAELAKM